MAQMIALALLLGASNTQMQIPEPFQGAWYEAHEGHAISCAEAGSGSGDVTVRSSHFEDPISEYKVTSVAVLSPVSVRVHFTRIIEDQNIEEKDVAIWTLQDKGKSLHSVAEGSQAREYISDTFRRCEK